MNPWWAPVSDRHLDPPDDPAWYDRVSDLTSHPSEDVQEAARAVLLRDSAEHWDALDSALEAWDKQWPKRCGCGREHTEQEWSQLKLAGVQRWEWGEAAEMRGCACGSTISVTIAEGDPELEHELELVDLERVA